MVFKYNHIDKNYVEATMKSVNVFSSNIHVIIQQDYL